MKYIIEAFSILTVLMMNLLVCIGVLTASADVAAAKEYKADVVAEIENSDFNPNVIDACELQAQALGYLLEVTPVVYQGTSERCIAQIKLTYNYEIPLLGISQQRVTRGVAR